MGRRSFERLVHERDLRPLEGDPRMYNLAPGYWVYDELVADLMASGWKRFGPGFKAGVYGHPHHPYCIKLLGMGVGDDPLFFAERGYYLEHERNMLLAFRRAGCDFAPSVLTQAESVAFLTDEARVRRHQAELRVKRNDLLVLEYIPGLALATQTGHHLNYDLNVDAFDAFVLNEMVVALQRLKLAVQRANSRDLVHNDPMPPNIIFTLRDGAMVAVLVDFELAEDLRADSPEHVRHTVAQLYEERNVPRGRHGFETNLDMHLISGSIAILETLRDFAAGAARGSGSDAITLEVPVIGGVSLALGQTWRYLRSRLS